MPSHLSQCISSHLKQDRRKIYIQYILLEVDDLLDWLMADSIIFYIDSSLFVIWTHAKKQYWPDASQHRASNWPSCICCEGDEVVIVKSDLRICGCGAALATGPIVQNKAYFEVKIQCGGKSCHAPV